MNKEITVSILALSAGTFVVASIGYILGRCSVKKASTSQSENSPDEAGDQTP